MPDRFERWVSAYEMVIRPARVPGRPSAPLSVETLSVLQQAVFEAARIRQPIADEMDRTGRYLFLQDMIVSAENQRVALLWTIGNTSASAPVFHNVETSQLRTAEMREGEALAFSAHMVIDLSDPAGSWRYPVAIEDVDGINRSRTCDLLQRELRKISTATAVVDGHSRSGPPTVEMHSLAGPLMNTGQNRPITIEVISLRPRRGMTADDAEFFVETRDEYIYKAVSTTPTDQLLDALPDFVNSLRDRHPGYRIRIRWKSDEDEKIRSTQADPSQRAQVLLERALTRTTLIKVEGAPLADAYDAIDSRIVEQLVATLDSDD